MTDPQQTIKVDPPSKEPPKRAGGLLGGIMILLALVALLGGFTALTALLGSRLPNSGWRLGLGLGVTWLLPVFFALWLRRRGGKRRRGPSGATLVLLVNVLLFGALALTVPGQTRAALEREGHWWVEATLRGLGAKEEGVLVDGAKLGARALARLLPATNEPLAKPGTGDSAGSAGGRSGAAEAPAAKDSGIQQPPPVDRGVDHGPPPPPGTHLVNFRKGQGGIIVPVTLSGPSGDVKVKMVFDTGASITTIDSRTVSRLGLHVTATDPTIITHTANGRAQRTLTVVYAADLGGGKVEGGLAVAICDPCAQGDMVGLLGLNFSRHFTVTVDHSGGSLILKDKRPDPGSLRDIKNFAELTNARGLVRGQHFEVTATLKNRSAHPLEGLRVAAKLASGQRILSPTLSVLPARSQVSLRFAGTAKGRAGRFQLQIIAGRWKMATYR